MEVKDSKLKAQTLLPVAQPASKDRCADDVRTRYLASRCLPRLRLCSAVWPPCLQTSIVPHLITSWSKGRSAPSSGQNSSPSDLVSSHPRCWDPVYPISPLYSLDYSGFCSSTSNDAQCFPLIRNNSWNCKPPWAKVHTFPSPAVKLIVKDVHSCLCFPCFCSPFAAGIWPSHPT